MSGTGLETLSAPLRPLQCQLPIIPAKPLAAAGTVRDVVGPHGTTSRTHASVGMSIVGDPDASGAANSIGRTGLLSRVFTQTTVIRRVPVRTDPGCTVASPSRARLFSVAFVKP